MIDGLRVRDLAKAYRGRLAVRGVSFTVGAGEIFGLLGPNGAGKTTTLECISGLRSPDAGSVGLDGVDPSRDPAGFKRRIGVLLQSTALQAHITPREALDLFGAFYPRRAGTRRLLERFALVEKAGDPFDALSGGEKQRLALALAFVNEPDLVILDEPTAGLDVPGRRALHGLIRELRAEGRAVLLSTHDLDEAQALCDRVAVLSAGVVAATGTPAELLARFPTAARITARLRHPLGAAVAGAWDLPAATPLRIHENEIAFSTPETGPAVIALVAHLQAAGNELLDLRVETPSLEEVFVELIRPGGGGLP